MFPGATDGPVSDARYAIVGAPLDVSGSFEPGARFGPGRIRRFAHAFEDYDHRTDQRFSDIAVVDRGDVRPWGDVPAYLDFLTGELGDVVEAGAFPLLLGGEHTVTVAGVRAAEPAVYVTLDAHLDLRERYDGYAMSHATVTHHVRDRIEDVIILGARAGSEEEWHRAGEDAAVTAIEPDETASWIEEELTDAVDGRDVYLSVDIDAFDPAYAPATGTKEPMGLTPEIARTVIQTVAPGLVGADVVEVTDRDHGQTATLAAKLVRHLIYTHASEQ